MIPVSTLWTGIFCSMACSFKTVMSKRTWIWNDHSTAAVSLVIRITKSTFWTWFTFAPSNVILVWSWRTYQCSTNLNMIIIIFLCCSYLSGCLSAGMFSVFNSFLLAHSKLSHLLYILEVQQILLDSSDLVDRWTHLVWSCFVPQDNSTQPSRVQSHLRGQPHHKRTLKTRFTSIVTLEFIFMHIMISVLPFLSALVQAIPWVQDWHWITSSFLNVFEKVPSGHGLGCVLPNGQ